MTHRIQKSKILRWMLGALFALYTPFFAIFVLAATPSMVILGEYFYVVTMPFCMGIFVLIMITRPQHIRVAAWMLCAVMGIWVLDNAGTQIYWLTIDVPAPGWTPMTLRDAALETLDGGIYWWFVLIPQLICALIATFFSEVYQSNSSLHLDSTRK